MWVWGFALHGKRDFTTFERGRGVGEFKHKRDRIMQRIQQVQGRCGIKTVFFLQKHSEDKTAWKSKYSWEINSNMTLPAVWCDVVKWVWLGSIGMVLLS